jgi:diguanylate cyclase
MIIKKFLLGGELHNDPIDAIKRRIFLVATPVGCLSMLLVWGIGMKQSNLPALDVFFLPFLAFLLLILAVLFWRNIIRLRIFELISYALILIYFLCAFASIFITIIFTKGSFSPNFTLWFPFIYVLSFLILSTKQALLFSAIYFFSTLLIGVGTYIYSLFDGLAIPNFSLLIQVYLASAFYIANFYLFARMKERYVSELAVADNMSKLAMVDSLTQVDNRRYLTQILQEEVKRAERHNLPLSILLFDLDWFKKINDSYGHNTGDKVLQEVAQELRQNIRSTDPFGRWGGDEFLCLAINSNGDQAVELAERLRVALERHRFDTVKKVTASFGVTTYQRGDTPETLVRRADLGLYKAKGEGRNRVEAVIAGVTLPLFEGEKPYSDSNNEAD